MPRCLLPVSYRQFPATGWGHPDWRSNAFQDYEWRFPVPRIIFSRRTVPVVVTTAVIASLAATSVAFASPGLQTSRQPQGPWVTSYTGSPVAGGTVSGFTPSCPADAGLADQ